MMPRDPIISLMRAINAVVAIVAFGFLMASAGSHRTFALGQGFLVVAMVLAIIGAFAPWRRDRP